MSFFLARNEGIFRGPGRLLFSTLFSLERSASSTSHQSEKDAARRIRLVISSSRHGTIDDVVKRLELDHGCSEIQMSTSLVEGLFRGFGDDWKSAMGFFRWAALCNEYNHTSTSFNRMVDLLGKMKQFDRMSELVSEMREKELITLDTAAKVMRRFSGAGMKDKAIEFFHQLEFLGLNKNTESMNILLDTLSKERHVETAREIYLELKHRIPPDAYTFNIFVHGWCNINRTDEAEWTIVEMRSYGLRPSVITYSIMVEAYCKGSSIDRVYEVLDKMHKEGCSPNVVTYTIAMHSVAKIHGYEAAKRIVDRMNASGCKPDRIFFNSLIFVLGRAGRLAEAARVFDKDMNLNGVAPDISTYNTMISLFCHYSDEEKALKVLEKMESASCTPDLMTYSPLFKLCLKGGVDKVDLLSFLVNQMVNKHQLSLDFATYSLLIHGLCRIGRTDWAFLLFEEMVNLEITPRNQTWKLLLKETEEKSMHSTAEKIKNLVKESRLWRSSTNKESRTLCSR
ncbi:pentatricopeptide repeat-containing protein At3g04130, mitochondrial-like [Wolffia australiana]